ncbi:MAG: type 4a pilus biogenesis protein PilO [Deltaproteobacteria bacterium]|nr:type 4a pilus biogenesis protein PilO [Deltaproteobacteria bacterium]
MMTSINSAMNTIRANGIAAIIALASAAIIAANILAGIFVLPAQEAEITRIGAALDAARVKNSPAAREGLAEEIGRFKEGLPEEKRLVRVIGEVLRTAKDNDLRVPEGDYSPATAKEADIGKYTLTFPVEGRYEQIKRFIHGVETLRYPFVIEEITLAGSKSGPGVIALKIKLSVYFR